MFVEGMLSLVGLKKEYSKGAGHFNCDTKEQVPQCGQQNLLYRNTTKTNSPSQDKDLKY